MSISHHTNEGDLPIIGSRLEHWRPRILPVLLAEIVLLAMAGAAWGGALATAAALFLAVPAAMLVRAASLAQGADGPGPADLVTGLRLGLALGTGALVLFADPPALLLSGLLLLALSTDALDGWIARRTKSASRFGARFDLETDTVLLAAAALAAATFAGPLVLAAPLLRPAWILAGRVLPWLARPLPPSLRRQSLCAVSIFLILAIPWPLGGTFLAGPAGLLATALLAVSFAIDLARQWRRHRPTRKSTA